MARIGPEGFVRCVEVDGLLVILAQQCPVHESPFEGIDMPGSAARWVKSNCNNPKLVKDLLRFLFDASAAGVNCWFLVGGGLIRSGSASLVHCFVGELFVFQLTDAQAAIQGVDRQGMCLGRGRVPLPQVQSPVSIAISLEGIDLLTSKITQTTPFIGRLHYEVLADGGGPWCVRMDYEMGNQHRHAWDYPKRPLWGKGMLDFSFLPIAPDPSVATNFKGPLALFVRLCAMSPPEQSESRRAISNTVATLVDVI
jgi:hypothetical protein